ICRSDIGKDGDHADPSEGEERYDLVVVSGVKVDVAVTQMHDLSDGSDIAGSLFHADDVVYIFYQCGQCLRLDRAARAARYVVEDRRDADGAADLGVMGDQT